MVRAKGFSLTSSVVVVFAAPAMAQINVIYNQIDGHPKNLMPAGAGLPAGAEFLHGLGSAFRTLSVSPDGSQFLLFAVADLPSSEFECLVTWNDNSAATMARTGTAFGAPAGTLLTTFDSSMKINDAGQFAFGADTNTNPSFDEVIMVWNGKAFELAAREGDFVPGFGTEKWTVVLDSAQILADGSAAYCGPNTIGPLSNAENGFCMAGDSVAVQKGDAIGDLAWFLFSAATYRVSPDGQHWIVRGEDTHASESFDEIVGYDGQVLMRESTPLAGTSYTSPVFFVMSPEFSLASDGTYIVRGYNEDNEDWVYRNGAVVASTDDPITPGNRETFDDATYGRCFFAAAVNSVGDYIVGGVTSEADATRNAVVVLNGNEVVLRKGDRVDLNGNGVDDDDAFIGNIQFEIDSFVLTNDLRMVFNAPVRTNAGASLGAMVLSKELGPVVPCPADANGNGAVNIDDMLLVINSWGSSGAPGSVVGDVTGDGTVNIDDLLLIINAWGPC